MRARPASAVAAAGAALRQQLESQRARDRCSLDQAHRHAIAQPVRLAAAIADEGMAVFVIAEIFLPDGARGNEAVGAGVEIGRASCRERVFGYV